MQSSAWRDGRVNVPAFTGASEPMWAFSNKTMLAEGLEGCMSFSTFSGCGSLPSTVTSPPEKESVSWLHPQGSLSLRLQGQPSESSFFSPNNDKSHLECV